MIKRLLPAALALALGAGPAAAAEPQPTTTPVSFRPIVCHSFAP